METHEGTKGAAPGSHSDTDTVREVPALWLLLPRFTGLTLTGTPICRVAAPGVLRAELCVCAGPEEASTLGARRGEGGRGRREGGEGRRGGVFLAAREKATVSRPDSQAS